MRFRDVGEKTLLLAWAPLHEAGSDRRSASTVGRSPGRRALAQVDDHGVDPVPGWSSIASR